MDSIDLLRSFGQGSTGRQQQTLICAENRRVADASLWRPGSTAFRLIKKFVVPPAGAAPGESPGLRFKALAGICAEILDGELRPPVPALSELAASNIIPDWSALDLPGKVLLLIELADAGKAPRMQEKGFPGTLRLLAAVALLVRLDEAVTASDGSIDGLARLAKRGQLVRDRGRVLVDIGTLERVLRAQAPAGELLQTMQQAFKTRARAGGAARAERYDEIKAFVRSEWRKNAHGFKGKADFARIYVPLIYTKFSKHVKPRTVSNWLADES